MRSLAYSRLLTVIVCGAMLCMGGAYSAAEAPPVAEDAPPTIDLTAGAHPAVVGRIQCPHRLIANGLQFLPDGRTLAALDTNDRGIRFYDIAKGSTTKRFLSDDFAASSFVLTSDGARLFVGSNHRVRQWETATERELTGVNDALGGILRLSADDRLLAGSYGSRIAVWRLELDGAMRPLRTMQSMMTTPDGLRPQRYPSVHSLAFSADTKLLFAGTSSGHVLCWQLDQEIPPVQFDVMTELAATSNPRRSTGRPYGCIHELAVFPNQSLIAYADGASQVAEFGYDLAGVELALSRVTTCNGPVAISPCGRYAAGHGTNGCVDLIDVQTGQTVSRFQVVPQVYLDRKQELDRTESRRKFTEQEQGEYYLCNRLSQLLAVAFSPDGNRLAMAAGDRVVWIVDLNLRPTTPDHEPPYNQTLSPNQD